MNQFKLIVLALAVTVTLSAQRSDAKSKSGLVSTIESTPGLVALWDFKEKEGHPRKAYGMGKFPLKEVGGTLPRINEGALSGYSALLSGKSYLFLPNSKTDKLNLFGPGQGVTVIAWIKWSGEQTGFVGGMWNEYQDGGKRQYGLFVSLPYYNGANQVCGHISHTGKPTPPFPYSVDYSTSKQQVEKQQWQCVAFTYDGKEIKSYLNGKFEPREPELINHTKGLMAIQTVWSRQRILTTFRQGRAIMVLISRLGRSYSRPEWATISRGRSPDWLCSTGH